MPVQSLIITEACYAFLLLNQNDPDCHYGDACRLLFFIFFFSFSSDLKTVIFLAKMLPLGGYVVGSIPGNLEGKTASRIISLLQN